jgi:putative membrane protein
MRFYLTMKLPAFIAVLVLGIGLGAGSLYAEEGLKDQTKPQIATSDGTFLTETARRNMTEIRMGELAKTKAGADAVKKLGDQLMVAHSGMNEDLKVLAAKKALNVWGDPENIRISELRQLESDAFDRAYLAEVVKHHEKAIGDFDEALKTSSDPEIKAFVAKYLPAMRSHLAMIKRLATPEAVAPARSASGL